MLKTICNMLMGALVAAAVGAASAYTVGTPPVPATGPGLVDGTWLNGLANGYNYSFQSGITALGTTQATATALPAGIYMVEVDTAGSGTGVNLPPCLAGTQLIIYNNGLNTINIFPAVANNPITAAQDTINNLTSVTLASHTQTAAACAKNGIWGSS